MGDLGRDTAVEPIGDGQYQAFVSPDWDLWGPVGGYLASIALRAAGTHTRARLPASLSCHFLSPPRFDVVQLEVKTLRSSRRAESLRVEMTQDGRAVLAALVWAVATGLPGPARTWAECPDVPPASDFEPFRPETELGAHAIGGSSFWKNVEIRKVPFDGESMTWHGGMPVLRSWDRYVPRSRFGDPWIDACRSVVSMDVAFFPAMASALPDLAFMAPNLDLYVAFHAQPPDEDDLLLEVRGEAAGSGLFGGHARTWSSNKVLTASGGSQLLGRMQ